MKKKLLLQNFLLSLFIFVALEPLEAQIKLPFAHKITVEFLDTPELSVADTTIKVRYNLKGSKKRYYNTRLYYSNNSGNSFKGPLRSLSGDIGDSTRAGKYKQISWSFIQDNPYFNGENIMFKIEAEEVPKISNGGPANALRSLLVPGLGDTKVRNGYNYGLITAATYGTLGTSLYFHLKARQKFNDYESRVPNTEEEHQKLFDEAQKSQRISRGFLIAGGLIWIADILGVYGRGIKNSRRLQKEKEEAESTGEASLWPQIIPNSDGRINQITLAWKF